MILLKDSSGTDEAKLHTLSNRQQTLRSFFQHVGGISEEGKLILDHSATQVDEIVKDCTQGEVRIDSSLPVAFVPD